MNVYNVVVFISLFMDVKGESYYVSTNEATDWKTATEQCNLAEPELIYSSHGVTVDMQNVTTNITEDVWIGYYIARTALEYFGCAKVGSYMPAYITQADPGQCFSACGVDNVIGISGNKCFCFNNDEIIGNGETLLSNCDETCNDLSPIVCGKSDDENAFMSLYRSIGPLISATGAQQGDRMCMFYNENGFDWRQCSHDHNFVCKTDAGSEVVEEDKTWIDATVSCFDKNKRPSTYNGTMSVSATKTKLWTGIVRSGVIYKYSSNPNISKFAEGHIYIGYVGGLESTSTITKKPLCLNETTTPSQTTTIHYTSETSTELTNAATDTPNSTHTLLRANKKESSNIGLIVGASVSAVVVIFIVIVAIVLIIRRRGTKNKQPPHQMSVHDNQAYAMSAMSATHQNQLNTDFQEEYADIDTATSAAAEAPDPYYSQSTSTPSSNSGYEDGPYDTTKGIHQKPDEVNFNPYNHLGGIEEESSDYDHIGKERSGHATSSKGVEDDNTYNTTDLGILKTSAGASDNIYNVTGENDSDDTYSHINGRKSRQTKFKASENDYDIFNQ